MKRSVKKHACCDDLPTKFRHFPRVMIVSKLDPKEKFVYKFASAFEDIPSADGYVELTPCIFYFNFSAS